MHFSIGTLATATARAAEQNYTKFGRKLDFDPESVLFVNLCKSVQQIKKKSTFLQISIVGRGATTVDSRSWRENQGPDWLSGAKRRDLIG